jgi:hypothetical protein
VRARELDEKSSRADPDELGVWLGSHDSILDDVAGLTPELRASLHVQYGPPGMRARAWAKPDGTAVEEAERPRLFSVALSSYLAEKGGRFAAGNEFAGMLHGLIAGEFPAARGPTPGSEAAEFDAEGERWRDVQRRHREFEATEMRRLQVPSS